MAITRTKKDSLVETKLSEKIVTDIKTTDKETEKNVEPKATKTKKPGFIATTIDELRKVRWPSWQYVLRWSGVIILFTFVFSVSLGFFDHAFTGGIKFVDCTSPQSRNQSIQSCGIELGEFLTFRRN